MGQETEARAPRLHLLRLVQIRLSRLTVVGRAPLPAPRASTYAEMASGKLTVKDLATGQQHEVPVADLELKVRGLLD